MTSQPRSQDSTVADTATATNGTSPNEPPAYDTVFAMPPPGAASGGAIPMPPPRQPKGTGTADEKTALQGTSPEKAKYTEGKNKNQSDSGLVFFPLNSTV